MANESTSNQLEKQIENTLDDCSQKITKIYIEKNIVQPVNESEVEEINSVNKRPRKLTQEEGKRLFTFECPLCGKSFSQEKILAEHITIFHQGEDGPTTTTLTVKDRDRERNVIDFIPLFQINYFMLDY